MGDQNISGAGPVDPRNQRMYEQEYRHGADLFKHALDQYVKSDNPYQQAEFKKVMDKAMQVLNQTAQGLMRKELQKQNEQISKDYATFKKYPKDQDTLNKLNQDLEKAKNFIKKD